MELHMQKIQLVASSLAAACTTQSTVNHRRDQYMAV